MSHILTMIESLNSKIKLLENSIAQAASQAEQWTKNHSGLIGMLQATKEALEDAKKLSILPSPIPEILNTDENVVNVVEKVVEDLSND